MSYDKINFVSIDLKKLMSYDGMIYLKL